MVTDAKRSNGNGSGSTGAEVLNDRQRLFAEKVAGGMAASAAYRAAGYTANGRSSESEASRMLRNPKIARYLDALRENMSRKSAATREDYRDLLASIAWDAGEATRDRLRAGEQLAKLLGWDAPDRHEVNAAQQEMSDLVRAVLQGARTRNAGTAQRR